MAETREFSKEDAQKLLKHLEETGRLRPIFFSEKWDEKRVTGIAPLVEVTELLGYDPIEAMTRKNIPALKIEKGESLTRSEPRLEADIKYAGV